MIHKFENKEELATYIDKRIEKHIPVSVDGHKEAFKMLEKGIWAGTAKIEVMHLKELYDSGTLTYDDKADEDFSSWHEMISWAFEDTGDSWDDVVDSTLTENQLHKRFDASYGDTEGLPFTLWTTNYVYFPGCYDGSEFVSSVPRNPCKEKTDHVGGGC